MRCRCCDKILNDYELTRKDPETGVHLDTCSGCLREIRESLREWDTDGYRYDVLLDVDKEL